MKIKTDILIIGAGPSGTVAAATLLKKGYDVTIIEKSVFPRFVIGESLLPRCMDVLREADLIEPITAAGFQKKSGAKFIHGDSVCDFDFTEQFTPGSRWTWQAPRADFDKILADTVEERGAKIVYDTTVTDVEINAEEVKTTVESNGEVQEYISKYIIDGSGYGRVLPRLFDLDKPSNQPSRSAFFTHLEDPNRPTDKDANRIHAIILAQDIWVWVIPFSNGNTSVGVVGNLSFIDENLSPEENFNHLLTMQPYLKERFTGAKQIFEPRRITGYSSSVKQFYGDRYVLTGNSTEFLDPIFSSGVTFAIESGALSAKLIMRELEGEDVDWQTEYVDHIQAGVSTFRSYVNAWYDDTLPTIFFAPSINQDIKERICSVLAGYVWDQNNHYVKRHDKALTTLAKVIRMQKK
ncbi:NAD(P)/FAD-dependent oxidoreductase [Crocinitomix catalasitica]|uniref:NAD(P)/FAD-dependent oxidoreductase n=1 Tax=Crocinitomix catalasitica TaxID=184607 RepID=UPI000A816505|nr:NAD(P)/FAD-dependent oxidoreductase [Crocinitomix catalasitica]